VHELRDEIVDLLLVAGIEGPHEVRVVEAAEDAHLATEGGLRLRCPFRARQHLHGHEPAHELVLRLEHLPHASLPQLVEEDVGAQPKDGAAREQFTGLIPGERPLLDEAVGQGRIPDVRAGLVEPGLRTDHRLGRLELLQREEAVGEGHLPKPRPASVGFR
jgi:hypothetical protein